MTVTSTQTNEILAAEGVSAGHIVTDHLVAIDRVASVLSGLDVQRQEALSASLVVTAGAVVVGRLLDDMPHELELGDGRMVRALRGDVIAGALGVRRALRGVAGALPKQLAVGSTLNVLNRGGVLGLAENAGSARLVVMGALLRDGAPAMMKPCAVEPLASFATIGRVPPVVAIAGSCMHAGKTAAAVALVHELTAAGYAVGAVKLTGVAAQRDVRAMQDAGATSVATFVDAGSPSTCSGGDVVAIARGCFAKVTADGVDVIVAELGDGLLGDYGVDAILAADDIRQVLTTVVLSAADPVAAWGGVELLARAGLTTTVVTGATTDNSAGRDAVTRHTGVPAANAIQQRGVLCHYVLASLHASSADSRQAAPKTTNAAPVTAPRPQPFRVAALAAVALGGL